MTDSEQLSALDSECATLRSKYEQAGQDFFALLDRRSAKADRVSAFHAWHQAGTTFFNAREKLIPLASRLKADSDPTYYTDVAETSLNLLEPICRHYEVLRVRGEELEINLVPLKPSVTAFANIQRIATATNRELALKLRDEFVKLGLPTYGFDKAESEKQQPHQLEWRFFILGCFITAVAVVMAAWGFSLSTLTKDQRFILHWIFPLCSGFASWCFAGSITARAKGWQGFAIAATGGFGVWLLSNFLLFKE
jgi:hypothetical protein